MSSNNQNTGQQQDVRVALWLNHNGDNTYRINYNLNPLSVVFDLGGYRGKWSQIIYAKYSCDIYIFEVHRLYASYIKTQFIENSKIRVFPYGLSDKTRIAQLGVEDDASSLFKKSNIMIDIQLVNIEDFFNEYAINNIDLMKINIEGGEYDLLEHLIKKGLICKIKNIQIQFHNFFHGAEERMIAIQEKLKLTHNKFIVFKIITLKN